MLHWEAYSNSCKSGFSTCNFSDKLSALCDSNEDIAWVVYHHNGENSLRWMYKKVPALDNSTPKSCLGSKVDKLKSILMTFPS